MLSGPLFILALTTFGLSPRATVPADVRAPDVVIDQVVRLTDNLCLKLVTAELRWTDGPVPSPTEAARFGLVPGVPDDVQRSLGHIVAPMGTRPSIASQRVENADLVVANAGPTEGCTVMLGADRADGATDAIQASLVKSGWRYKGTQQIGILEHRHFIVPGPSHESYFGQITAINDSSHRL